MSLTYFETEDAVVTISDEGYARLASEQRLHRVDRLYTDIRIGAAAGGVVTLAALIAIKLLGW